MKAKSIFSPRKLIIWAFILIIAITIPEFNKPAMSETEAIITSFAVDMVDGEVKVAMAVLTPTEGKSSNNQVFSGSGSTLGEAVDSVSLSIGKDVGFAQCQVMAVGENIGEIGLMSPLDYLTRTKKVGRNTILVSFDGNVTEFVTALTDLSKNKALTIDKIMNYCKQYLLSKISNIETFYRGYYSDVSIGVMPKISLVENQEYNAIKLTDGESPLDTESNGNSSGDSQKYLLIDGSMVVFKQGKKYLDITRENVKKLNLYVNDDQKESFVLEHVNDEKYNDATVSVTVEEKTTDVSVDFEGGMPVYKAKLDIVIYIDEIVENGVNKNLVQRAQELYTDELFARVKEEISTDMKEIVKFCKTNNIDLLNSYKLFNALKHKKFKNYLSEVGEENFLQDIRFDTEIKITNEF